jgi:hypothetical protein
MAILWRMLRPRTEARMKLARTIGKSALVGLFATMAVLPVAAQEVTAPVEPWQAVITSQIEAFRAKDAPGAFEYAAAAFHAGFPSAEAFFVAIVGSGYAPIMESRSHSFGKYEKLGDTVVLQEVKLVGNDQSLYEALYQLSEETEGWRVSGVQLLKQPGMGI